VRHRRASATSARPAAIQRRSLRRATRTITSDASIPATRAQPDGASWASVAP
jgi:hypothetical protein